MLELHFTTRGEGETEVLGERLGSVLRAGDVLTLDGELGAGKTRLVRGIARAMGVDERMVASPTFVIVHEYPAASALSPPLVHVDAYRLTGAGDLETLGWERLCDGTSVVVIEWGQNVVAALPEAARLFILAKGETEREFRLLAPESWANRPEWNRLVRAAEGHSGGARSGVSGEACPTCGVRAPESGSHRPFCSERCRMAELWKWFSGQYTVSREVAEDDYSDPDLTP